MRKRTQNLLYLSGAVLATAVFMLLHPALAMAADAAAAAGAAGLDLQEAAGKFLDFSQVTLGGIAGQSMGLYAMIEGWVAHRLDGTPLEKYKRYVPAVFSFLIWLAGGLHDGASAWTIAKGTVGTALGSMFTHDLLANMGGLGAVLGGAAKVVSTAGEPGRIDATTYMAWKAKGDPRVYHYNEDGTLKGAAYAVKP